MDVNNTMNIVMEGIMNEKEFQAVKESICQFVERSSMIELSRLLSAIQQRWNIHAIQQTIVQSKNNRALSENTTISSMKYSVYLCNVDVGIIPIIKLYRGLTSKSLAESRDIVSAAKVEPQRLCACNMYEEAEMWAKKFENIGAGVQIRSEKHD